MKQTKLVPFQIQLTETIDAATGKPNPRVMHVNAESMTFPPSGAIVLKVGETNVFALAAGQWEAARMPVPGEDVIPRPTQEDIERAVANTRMNGSQDYAEPP